MSEEPRHTDDVGLESETGSRDKIIAAALGEFAEHGRAGARVDRIAAAAGVNKAMIYYHFKSKDELYIQVLRSFFLEIGREARQKLSASANLEEALKAILALHTGIATRRPQVRTLLLRELADLNPDVMDAIVQSFEESGMAQTMRERMMERIQDGHVREIDPRQLITAFIGMSLGYHLLFPIMDRLTGIKDRGKFLEERQRIIVDIFLNGIKVK